MCTWTLESAGGSATSIVPARLGSHLRLGCADYGPGGADPGLVEPESGHSFLPVSGVRLRALHARRPASPRRHAKVDIPGGIFQQVPGTKVPISPHATVSGGCWLGTTCPCPATMTWPGMGDFLLE